MSNRDTRNVRNTGIRNKAAAPNPAKAPSHTAPAGPKSTSWWKDLLVVLLLTLPFWVTLGHDYALDDHMVILANKYVQQGISAIPSIFSNQHWYADHGYRPLTAISFAVEKELFDSSPFWSHFINVVLYGITLLVLVRLLGLLLPLASRTMILIGLGLFALHPVHTEVVANVKGRDEMLSLLFFITALLLFLQSFQSGSRSSRLKRIGSLVFFLCALLSKESSVALFPVFGLSLFFVQEKSWRRCVSSAIPYFVISLGYASLLHFGLEVRVESTGSIINNSLMLASTPLVKYGTILKVFGKYLLLLFWPYPLIHDYSYNQIPLVVSVIDPGFLVGLTFLICTIGFTAYAVKKRKLFGLGSALFLLGLLPVSNILFPIGATMGERFLYVPSLALPILFLSLKLGTKRCKPVLYGFVVIVGTSMAGYSAYRAMQWRNNLTLFQTDIRNGANNANMQQSMGNWLIHLATEEPDSVLRGKYYQEAIPFLKRSVEIYEPNYFAHGNLGIALHYTGSIDSAFVHLSRAEELENGGYVTGLAMADLLMTMGRYDQAYQRYSQANRLLPTDPQIVLKMADILVLTGDRAKALSYYRSILQAYPGFEAARQRLRLLDSMDIGATVTE